MGKLGSEILNYSCTCLKCLTKLFVPILICDFGLCRVVNRSCEKMLGVSCVMQLKLTCTAYEPLICHFISFETRHIQQFE